MNSRIYSFRKDFLNTHCVHDIVLDADQNEICEGCLNPWEKETCEGKIIVIGLG